MINCVLTVFTHFTILVRGTNFCMKDSTVCVVISTQMSRVTVTNHKYQPHPTISSKRIVLFLAKLAKFDLYFIVMRN